MLVLPCQLFFIIIFSLLFRKGIIFHEINWPKSNKAPVIFKGNFLFHNIKLLKDKCVSKAQQIALIAALLSQLTGLPAERRHEI